MKKVFPHNTFHLLGHERSLLYQLHYTRIKQARNLCL